MWMLPAHRVLQGTESQRGPRSEEATVQWEERMQCVRPLLEAHVTRTLSCGSRRPGRLQRQEAW